MEVTVRHQDGRVESLKVGKFVHPYPIEGKTKDEIIRLQKAGDDEVAYGWFSFEGKDCPIARVVICGKPTWFIDGHPLLTVFEYTPTRICVQIKMARGGDWGNGERRREYQAFVYNVVDMLGGCSLPMFNDRTDDYFNEMTSIDCNGLHPFALVK